MMEKADMAMSTNYQGSLKDAIAFHILEALYNNLLQNNVC